MCFIPRHFCLTVPKETRVAKVFLQQSSADWKALKSFRTSGFEAAVLFPIALGVNRIEQNEQICVVLLCKVPLGLPWLVAFIYTLGTFWDTNDLATVLHALVTSTMDYYNALYWRVASLFPIQGAHVSVWIPKWLGPQIPESPLPSLQAPLGC